jgi:transcriptional regulator with XRE-family HTH domain
MSDKINLDEFEVIRPDYMCLADYRTENGLSQQQFADALEIPLEKYQQYESGKADISNFLWNRFMSALYRLTGKQY